MRIRNSCCSENGGALLGSYGIRPWRVSAFVGLADLFTSCFMVCLTSIYIKKKVKVAGIKRKSEALFKWCILIKDYIIIQCIFLFLLPVNGHETAIWSAKKLKINGLLMSITIWKWLATNKILLMCRCIHFREEWQSRAVPELPESKLEIILNEKCKLIKHYVTRALHWISLWDDLLDSIYHLNVLTVWTSVSKSIKPVLESSSMTSYNWRLTATAT